MTCKAIREGQPLDAATSQPLKRRLSEGAPPTIPLAPLSSRLNPCPIPRSFERVITTAEEVKTSRPPQRRGTRQGKTANTPDRSSWRTGSRTGRLGCSSCCCCYARLCSHERRIRTRQEEAR